MDLERVRSFFIPGVLLAWSDNTESELILKKEKTVGQ